MKVSELNTKYEVVELIESDPSGSRIIGRPTLSLLESFKKACGEMHVYSVMDFDRSMRTSIIYGEEPPIHPTFFSARDD